jgi:hypothetical protein
MKQFTMILPSPINRYFGLTIATSSRRLYLGQWETTLPHVH